MWYLFIPLIYIFLFNFHLKKSFIFICFQMDFRNTRMFSTYFINFHGKVLCSSTKFKNNSRKWKWKWATTNNENKTKQNTTRFIGKKWCKCDKKTQFQELSAIETNQMWKIENANIWTCFRISSEPKLTSWNTKSVGLLKLRLLETQYLEQ